MQKLAARAEAPGGRPQYEPDSGDRKGLRSANRAADEARAAAETTATPSRIAPTAATRRAVRHSL